MDLGLPGRLMTRALPLRPGAEEGRGGGGWGKGGERGHGSGEGPGDDINIKWSGGPWQGQNGWRLISIDGPQV
jgi:hypothetical protein